MSIKDKVGVLLTTIIGVTLIADKVFASSQLHDSRSATTFKVWDKVPEKYVIRNPVNSSHDLVQNLEGFQTNQRKEVIQATKFSSTAFPSGNGFVNAVVEAYRGHHNLIIRPDDIWAAIMTQFSFYVNKHAEKFRKKFVNFEGKKELVVEIPGTLRTAPYDLFVNLTTEQIHKNLVDPQVRSWILPKFTTTTENDLVTVGVIFMASMKKYFSYTASITCGIPSITLEGSLEDWKDIQTRLGKLKEYELTEWYEMLIPILNQFVSAKGGNADVDFWKRICRVKEVSGGCAREERLSGWITAFATFDGKGEKVFNSARDQDEFSLWPTINVEDVPSGLVEVDVKILEHGTEYNATMFAGHMAIETKDDGFTLQPSLGWGITI